MGDGGRRGRFRRVKGVTEGPGQGVRRTTVGDCGDHVAPVEPGHRHLAHRLGQDGDGVRVLGGASGEGVLHVEDHRVRGGSRNWVCEPIRSEGGRRLHRVDAERGVNGPVGRGPRGDVHVGDVEGHGGTSIHGEGESGRHFVLHQDARVDPGHASSAVVAMRVNRWLPGSSERVVSVAPFQGYSRST